MAAAAVATAAAEPMTCKVWSETFPARPVMEALQDGKVIEPYFRLEEGVAAVRIPMESIGSAECEESAIG